MNTILWIDQNKDSCYNLRQVLSEADVYIDRILKADALEPALAYVIDHRPQLIITDILLKDCNYIEVIQHVLKIDPNIKVIIYSSHSSFELAVKAFKLGVVCDYLIKPETKNDTYNLVPAIKKAYKQIQEHRDCFKKSMQKNQTLELLKPYAKAQLLNHLIFYAQPIPTIDKLVDILNIDLLGHQTYTVCITQICTDDHTKDEQWIELNLLTILSSIEEWIGVHGIVFRTLNHQVISVIFNINTPSLGSRQQLLTICQQYIDVYVQNTQNAIVVCVGPTVDSLNQLRYSYLEAQKTDLVYRCSKQNQVFDCTQHESSKQEIVFPFDKIDAVISDILSRKNKNQAASNLIAELSACPNLSPENLKVIYFEIVSRTEFLEHYNSSPSDHQLSQAKNCVFDIYTITDLEQAIFAFHKERLNALAPQRTIINQVIDYIHTAFTNPELSLKYIADSLFISVSHLSAVFHKECHCTFKEYLNACRIESSKKLLIDTTMSIAEIACKTGYNDAQYYAKVFKKSTNVTPTEYRNNHTSLN